MKTDSRPRCSLNRAAVVIAVALAAGGCSREPAAWEEATAHDTLAAYESYLQNHPNGEHAADAGARIADFDWEAAASSAAIEDLAAFIDKHPDDSRVDEARQRLAGLEEARDWSVAVQTSSAAGFRAFLDRHPDAARAREADFMRRLHEVLEEKKASDFRGVTATITGYDAGSDGISFELDERFDTPMMKIETIGMQEASKLVHPPGDMVAGQRIHLYMALSEIDIGRQSVPIWAPVGFRAMAEPAQATRE